MHHGTTTVITRIRPDALRTLEARLAEASALRTSLFAGVPGLHFARWAIIDLTAPEAAEGDRDLRLVFGADFNVAQVDVGARADAVQLDRSFLHHFVSWLLELREQGARAASVFDDLYRTCPGYPEQGLAAPAEVEDWLLQHCVSATARHVDFAYRFESPDELREAVDVLRAVNEHLDVRAPLLKETPWRGQADALPHLHRELRDVALSVSSTVADAQWTQRLASARSDAATASLRYPFYRYLWTIPAIQGLRLWLALFGPKPPAKVWGPCAPELTSRRSPPPPHDAMVQHPMVHVARITGGRAAVWLTKLALPSVNLRLRRYVVGLNHIRTIHCARWLLHGDARGGHHLLFFSNYDDSWEAYIDSFVDHKDVRDFLELIWRRTEGFPQKTRGFVPTRAWWGGWKKGLPVEPFKAWLRGHEVPTQVWYSAALDGGPRQRHSVVLLHDALRLRELLARERIDRPLRDWPARRALATFLSHGAFVPGRALLRLPALLHHSLSALAAGLRTWRKPRVLDRPAFPPYSAHAPGAA
ncbi:hypothetical protein [Pyxidicoccus xibeiensis]|uniref:hypothetical protein n=1 Tax=Pyxidicoccus xibeiensis TaxID=2906759 RepID=UPI0020A7B4DB|nr:hypothetical protein [Pyxidicoccus xibeiensis]MCP3137861.1 hypothetical protein [Pyxidicoccus xibeiensis]